MVVNRVVNWMKFCKWIYALNVSNTSYWINIIRFMPRL